MIFSFLKTSEKQTFLSTLNESMTSFISVFLPKSYFLLIDECQCILGWTLDFSLQTEWVSFLCQLLSFSVEFAFFVRKEAILKVRNVQIYMVLNYLILTTNCTFILKTIEHIFRHSLHDQIEMFCVWFIFYFLKMFYDWNAFWRAHLASIFTFYTIHHVCLKLIKRKDERQDWKHVNIATSFIHSVLSSFFAIYWYVVRFSRLPHISF